MHDDDYYAELRIKVRVNGDSELIGLVSKAVDDLVSMGAELYVALDGANSHADTVSPSSVFDVANISMYTGPAEFHVAVSNLIEQTCSRGQGYGVLVSGNSEHSVLFEAHGDIAITEIGIEAVSHETEWDGMPAPTVMFKVGTEQLCKLLSCTVSELEGVITRDGNGFLTKLLGEGLARDIFGFDMTGTQFGIAFNKSAIREVLPDEGKVICWSPEGSWGDGVSSADFVKHRDTFRRAAEVLKEHGGWIDILWDGSDGHNLEPRVVNTFVSGLGYPDSFSKEYMRMTFESGPNYWGEFKIENYDL